MAFRLPITLILQVLFAVGAYACRAEVVRANPVCTREFLEKATPDFSDAAEFGAMNARNLPAKINFRPSAKALKTYSDFAKLAMQKENKISALTVLIDQLSKNEATPEALQKLVELQNGREIGNLSRDKNFKFDQSHEAAKKLKRLQAAIRNSDPLKIETVKTRITLAQDLQKTLDQLPDREGLAHFNVVNTDAFDDDFRATVSKANRLMRAESLTPSQHDELRQILRQFQSYYQVKNAVAQSAENDAILNYLNALVNRMGDENRARVLNSIGSAVDLKTTKTPLAYPDRKKIREFLKRVDRDQSELY